MKLLFENWRRYINEDNSDDSDNINADVKGGNISGVIHKDKQRILNWAEKERISPEAINIISKLQTPMAILKNINVEEEARNQGTGTDLLQQFLDKAYNMPILLISDESEDNAFGLTDWYTKYGFEHVGESGGHPVLLRKADEGDEYSDKIIKLLTKPDHIAQAVEFLSSGVIDLDLEQFIKKLWNIVFLAQKKEEERDARTGGAGPRFKNNMDYYYLRMGIAEIVGACDPYCDVNFIPANKHTPVHQKYGPSSPMFKRHSDTWNFEEFKEMFQGKLQ